MNETYSTIRPQHDLAMSLADRADEARRLGDHASAAMFWRQSFEAERDAALAYAAGADPAEPWRSVLFRSAASIAMRCDEHRSAEKMIAMGLAGDPPADIAAELRELMAEILPKLTRERAIA